MPWIPKPPSYILDKNHRWELETASLSCYISFFYFYFIHVVGKTPFILLSLRILSLSSPKVCEIQSFMAWTFRGCPSIIDVIEYLGFMSPNSALLLRIRFSLLPQAEQGAMASFILAPASRSALKKANAYSLASKS